MPRNYDQIIRSKENNTFALTDEQTAGTVSVTKTVAPNESVFVTDIAGRTKGATAKLSILEGTTFVFQMQLTSSDIFSKSFYTPIKINQGTSCTAKVEGPNAIVNVFLGGYTVRY